MARSRRSTATAVLGTLLCAGAAGAEMVRVAVTLPPSRIAEKPTFTVVAEPHTSGATSLDVEPVRVTLTAPGEATIELESSLAWTFEAEAPGFWAAPETVFVKGPSSVELRGWPTGRVRGRVSTDSGGRPRTLFARFQSSSPEEDRRAIPQAEVECPVDRGLYTCEVPVGVVDLRLRARGFVPHYRWGYRVRRGVQTIPLELQRGASVVGWVKTAVGPPAGPATSVALQPATRAHSELVDPEHESMYRSVAPNDRGFFQFETVPPGMYVVAATQEGFAPTRTGSIAVLRDSEATVLEPLILSRPARLQLSVSPPETPEGERWGLRLSSISENTRVRRLVAEETLPADGWWQSGPLAPGTYQLIVRSGRSVWFHEEVQLTDQLAPLAISLPSLELQGKAYLGEEPLPEATLRFKGRERRESIVFKTDEEGEFSGALPRAGSWGVRAQRSKNPQVDKTLEDVQVAEPAQGTVARLTIRLPSTKVRGMVVDSEHRPAAQAIVTAVNRESLEPFSSGLSDQVGAFELHGLSPGDILLSAEGIDGTTSEWVEIRAAEGVETRRALLVLRDTQPARGRVTFRGNPVVGAQVIVTPAAQPLYPVESVLTDIEGRFETSLPSGIEEATLSVQPPGFAMRIFRAPFRAGEELSVAVEQIGGRLVVEHHTELDLANWFDYQAVVLHNGGLFGLTGLQAWARFNGQPQEDADRLVIPQMESGDYTLCLIRLSEATATAGGFLPADRCVSGYLAPLGELSLVLPAPPKRE